MTENEAIKLSQSEWWKKPGVTAHDIVSFQLYEPRLCMDFGDFQDAVQEVLLLVGWHGPGVAGADPQRLHGTAIPAKVTP